VIAIELCPSRADTSAMSQQPTISALRRESPHRVSAQHESAPFACVRLCGDPLPRYRFARKGGRASRARGVRLQSSAVDARSREQVARAVDFALRD
jgi:hypothetical protein